MTKLLRNYSMLLTCFFAFMSIAVFCQTNTTACIGDTLKPVYAACPQDIVLSTLDSCIVAQWAVPTATDNCGVLVTTESHTSVLCFGLGTTPITYTAIDSSGNVGVCIFNVIVSRTDTSTLCVGDVTRPRFIGCPQGQLIGTFDSCAIATWNAPLATDNCYLASVSSNYTSGTCFPTGFITSVVYTAKDFRGNMATCSFTINIFRNTVSDACATDTTKPIFTNCPTAITTATSDTCARVTFITPYATDNCGVPTVSGTHLSGACFNLGSTTVVYTATDAKANTATCSFTVTVMNACLKDTIKPLILNCPLSKTVGISTTASCVAVQWTAPTSTDNCSVPTLKSNLQNGSCFRLGTKAVVYTATDASRNTSTCVFSITVSRSVAVDPCAVDSIKPVFASCPVNATVTTLDACAIVQFATPVATDNCGTPSVLGNFSTGTCFPLGTTNVVYTATDLKGNVAFCSFTVTVVNPCTFDTLKPR